MGKRVLIIVLAVVLLLGVLLVGAVGGGVLAYFALQGRSARADFSPSEAIQVIPHRQSQGGVLIAGVNPDSPAAQAGLVRGDIILEMNGQALEQGPLSLQRALQEVEPRATVELLVQHGDEQRTVEVTPQVVNNRAVLGINTCAGEIGAQLPGSHRNLVGGGVIITEVISGSPAEQAGLQAGDRIVAVGDTELNTDTSFADIIAGYQPGDQVQLTIARSGEENQTVEVTLGENPDQAGKTYLGVRYQQAPAGSQDRQMPFQLNPEDGQNPFDSMPGFPFFQLPGGFDQAVVIAEVTAGSPAEEAGLQSGDLITAIDGQAVSDPQALVEAVQSHKPGDTVELDVYRNDSDQPQQIQVTLGENPDQAGQAYMGVKIGIVTQSQEGDGQNIPFPIPPQEQPSENPALPDGGSA